METLKGQKLTKACRVRVVAPAGPFAKVQFFHGIARLQSWGLHPTWREDVFESENFWAGSDERRAAEFNEAIVDEKCRAVFCARGGYGSIRILDRIDIPSVANNPKPVIGFSDNTALILYLYAKCGLASIHGPMPAGEQFSMMKPEVESWFQKCLFCSEAPGDMPLFQTKIVKSGRTSGRIIAGNMTIIIHLLAAGLMPDPTDCILFLEDVNESDYRIDRMLCTLKLAGVLERIRGIVFGEYLPTRKTDLRRIVEDYAKYINGPVLIRGPLGHGEVNVPIPVGTMAELDADASRLTILESVVC